MGRKLGLIAVCAAILIGTAGVSGTAAAQGPGTDDAPQIGVNFIRFFMADQGPRGAMDTVTPSVQPEAIFEDFAALGVDSFRQFPLTDLMWNTIEPQDDQWRFEGADAVLLNPDRVGEPIVTLFAMQYASPTPPWVTDPAAFEKTLGPEAIEYLETVIDRYGDVVRYWEIGNEMDHWRAADPVPEGGAADPLSQIARLPGAVPVDGFSPQEQGVFFAQVADFIRERDSDAVIVMPGMGGLDDYTINTWLAGVIEGGGTDWFDVVNYHFYSPWAAMTRLRPDLQTFLETNGLDDRPVWLTETGSTASPTLTGRTDYPNSPESQAADVFRRLVQGYAFGDSLVMWHTYIGSPDTPDNVWRLYGVRQDPAQDAAAQPSYYALQLFIAELIPLESAEAISVEPQGANIYRVTTEGGAVRYVAWGSGTYTVPEGMSAMTSVMPAADGSYTWQAVTPGSVITLVDTPVLLH